MGNRVKIDAGDFFERFPAGGDAYLLSHIIHDWSEAQCLTILAKCRGAMSPGSRLLIIEMVLPSGDAPHLGKMLDLVMLDDTNPARCKRFQEFTREVQAGDNEVDLALQN